MGLDVYLYRCENRELARAAEQRAEAASNAIWEECSTSMTDAQRDELHKRSAAASHAEGCDDWCQHRSVEQIDLPSKLYPEHLFRIGYFRSSYNSGGINSVFHKIGLPDLYGIMKVNHSEYEVHHDWAACRESINTVIEEYEAHLNSDMGRFHVMELHQPIDRVDSAKEALELFKKEFERKSISDMMFSSYSNRTGEFYLDGLKAHAFIPSSDRLTSMYVIVSKEESTEDDWYLQALKIMRETCDYVLAQPDPQNYYMRWSG